MNASARRRSAGGPATKMDWPTFSSTAPVATPAWARRFARPSFVSRTADARAPKVAADGFGRAGITVRPNQGSSSASSAEPAFAILEESPGTKGSMRAIARNRAALLGRASPMISKQPPSAGSRVFTWEAGTVSSSPSTHHLTRTPATSTLTTSASIHASPLTTASTLPILRHSSYWASVAATFLSASNICPGSRMPKLSATASSPAALSPSASAPFSSPASMSSSAESAPVKAGTHGNIATTTSQPFMICLTPTPRMWRRAFAGTSMVTVRGGQRGAFAASAGRSRQSKAAEMTCSMRSALSASKPTLVALPPRGASFDARIQASP
mmetsp:Transcript_65294/g.181556  ORF Transcript_65294/g.181556 Transcript_65294/m.181556 type:complete len:327 (+) Transcript_65294:109-1089(+)